MLDLKRKLFIASTLIISILFFSCQWNPKQNTVDQKSNEWMKELPDSTSLTSLTIPGTHDTCAMYDFLIGGASATQDIPLYEQLEKGIRFLDIRISKQKDGTLGIYHGIKYMYIDFDEVVKECKNFLEKHPSEFILMMVKEEVFRSEGTGESFTDNIYTLMEKDPTLWANPADWQSAESYPYPDSIAPLRGKILLFRNYKESSKGTTKAVNIYQNPPDYWVRQGDSATVPQGDIQTIEDKWEQVSAYIDARSQKTDNRKLYIHSVAAYNALIAGLPNIDNVAKVVNPLLTVKLKEGKAKYEKKPIGILMCDKVYPELITAIYSLNF